MPKSHDVQHVEGNAKILVRPHERERPGAGRPVFTDLMFHRRPPIFVAFDVLVDRGEDVRALPLARRKAVLRRLARGARRWIAVGDCVPAQGRRLFELVAENDLEGIVANSRRHVARVA